MVVSADQPLENDKVYDYSEVVHTKSEQVSGQLDNVRVNWFSSSRSYCLCPYCFSWEYPGEFANALS